MLESFAVKDLLRMLLVFVALFVLVNILFTVLGLLGVLGDVYAAKTEPLLSGVIARIPHILLERLPLALCATLLLLLARSGVHPGRSLPAFVLVGAASFFTLVFAFPLLEATIPAGMETSDRVYTSALAPGYWHSDNGRAYYVESIEDGRFSSLLVVTPDEKQARFRYFAAGEAEGPLVTASGPGSTDRSGGPSELSAFTPERFTAQLEHDLRLLRQELSRAYLISRPRYLLACFAVVSAFMAAVFLMRLSRWPLLNLFLSFLALRGVFYQFRLLREVVSEELATLISRESVTANLPFLVLLVFSGLLLLLHLLFLPARRGPGGAAI
jgi:hypothetical protein